MISDSATLLAVLLERRFGACWVRRWQRLVDREARWLAIYLADEASKGRDLTRADAASRAIVEGRAHLPFVARGNQTAAGLLGALHVAGLWPLPEPTRAIMAVDIPGDRRLATLGADV